jgi:O-antigen/teichoic acid export membrane protein
MGLTPHLGIIGAALARVSSSFLSFTLIYNELRHWIRIEIDWNGLWKGLLASVIPAASLFLFNSIRLSSTPINLSLGIGFGVLSYFFSLILLRALRREDFHDLRQIIPMFTGFIDFIERIVGTKN